MKKFLFFVVCVFVSVFANAQSFTPVTHVAKVNKSYVAYGDGACAPLTAAQYLKLKKSVAGYSIVSYKGKDAANSFNIVVSDNEYDSDILTVDSVGVADSGVEVYFTNGTMYLAKSAAWADVLKGQNVAHITIKSPLRHFEKYEALENVPVGFEVKHGLTAAAKAKKSVLAKVSADVKSAFSEAKEKVEEKVDNFIDPKVPAKSAAYSVVGGFKLIQE